MIGGEETLVPAKRAGGDGGIPPVGDGVGGGSKSSSFRSHASRRPSKQRQCELDFERRLAMLLSMHDGAEILAKKIYARFGGKTDQIPDVLQLLERTWGFPSRLFPLLWTHVRRAAFRYRGECTKIRVAGGEAPGHIAENEWVEAFQKWVQAVRTRCGPAKLSRRGLVRKRDTKNAGNIRDVYFQGPRLGEGANGEVFVMFHKLLGVERAVKSIHKDQLSMATSSAEVEVNILTTLDHPHIVRIYETFEVDDELHIVMDYAEGGDLAAVIKLAAAQGRTLTEDWVCTASQQICAALDYMHSKGVVHCDLKPANVMLLKPTDASVGEMPHVLLVDFGIAEIFQERRVVGPMKVKGTPLYLAPEAFEGDVTEKSDMWAVGVMIYEMLAGRRPFEADNVVVLLSKVATSEPSMTSFSHLVQEVLNGLLIKDPIARLTAQECRAQEWFTNNTGMLSPVNQGSSREVETISHISYFHRAAMFCIAAELSMKQMGELFKIFQDMDTDKSGYLSHKQFADGLKRLRSKKDPAELIAILDSDQNGVISYTEFLAGILGTRQHISEQLLREAFSVFDLDGDGLISMHELRVMLSGSGPLVEVLPDGKTIDEIMEEVGQGDGFISFPNFVKYVRNEGFTESELLGDAPASSRCSSKDPSFVLDDMIQDVDGKANDVRPNSSLQLRVLSRQSSVASRFETGLPPLHRWMSEVRGEEMQRSSIQRFLSFPEQCLDPPLSAQHLSNIRKHFTACTSLADFLAQGALQEENVLREAMKATLDVTSPKPSKRGTSACSPLLKEAKFEKIPESGIAERPESIGLAIQGSPPIIMPRDCQENRPYSKKVGFPLDRNRHGQASEPMLLGRPVHNIDRRNKPLSRCSSEVPVQPMSPKYRVRNLLIASPSPKPFVAGGRRGIPKFAAPVPSGPPPPVPCRPRHIGRYDIGRKPPEPPSFVEHAGQIGPIFPWRP